MAITKKTIKASTSRMPARNARPVMASRRAAATPRSINAGTSVTASARTRRSAMPVSGVKLTPAQQAFTNTLRQTYRSECGTVMAATNTSNIPAKPEFTQLLPLFTQKLLIPEIMGTVAMNSRQQLVPYYKFIAENTKGVTSAGTVLSSAFVNRQGRDPDFTGRVIRNEDVTSGAVAYTPVLPGSVSIIDGANKYYDNNGAIIDAATGTPVPSASIDYATGAITGLGATLSVSYEYDNETVGPDQNGQYGAKMAKGYLQLDEINLVATAHELACYWSVYSAFAASKEWGSDIGKVAQEAAISELVAEINSLGFNALTNAAGAPKPQFNWDAAPVLSGAVNPQGYLNMFMMKLNQAAAAIYQATNTVRPNKLIIGTAVDACISMMDKFQAEAPASTVGPYKSGKLGQYDVYVNPNQDPNLWVMTCKDDNDFRKTAALYGEYMPIVNTDEIGLANLSVQKGWATMYDLQVINPDLIVSGKITGSF